MINYSMDVKYLYFSSIKLIDKNAKGSTVGAFIQQGPKNKLQAPDILQHCRHCFEDYDAPAGAPPNNAIIESARLQQG